MSGDAFMLFSVFFAKPAQSLPPFELYEVIKILYNKTRSQLASTGTWLDMTLKHEKIQSKVRQEKTIVLAGTERWVFRGNIPDPSPQLPDLAYQHEEYSLPVLHVW